MQKRVNEWSLLIVSYCRTDLSAPEHYPSLDCTEIAKMEVFMLLTAKLNLMSGMVIGAAAVMVMKQMCKRKQRKKHQETPAPVAASD